MLFPAAAGTGVVTPYLGLRPNVSFRVIVIVLIIVAEILVGNPIHKCASGILKVPVRSCGAHDHPLQQLVARFLGQPLLWPGSLESQLSGGADERPGNC